MSLAQIHEAVLMHTLDEPIPNGANVIFVSGFPLQLVRGNIVGEICDATGPSQLTRAGGGEDFIRKLEDDLVANFGATTNFNLPQGISENDVAVYAFAQICPTFSPQFLARERGVTFGGNDYPSFGVWKGENEEARASLAGRVVVCHYGGPLDFVVELPSATSGERIFVARCRRESTLAALASHVTRCCRRSGSLWSKWFGGHRLRRGDVLKIPSFELRVVGIYSEMIGRRLPDHRPIVDARHVVEVSFDGGGAESGGPSPLALGRGELYERYFVCDGPFFVLLLDGNQTPKAALWIESMSHS